MKLLGTKADAALLSTLLLFPSLGATAGGFLCTSLIADGVEFDFSALGGPRSVVHNVGNPASSLNTTYTIDVCKPLKKAKDIPSELQCPNGARICSITRLITPDQDVLEDVFPVAGQLREVKGGDLNAKWERLKHGKSHTDSEKEGLLVELNGGFKEEDDKKIPQKAIIEFLCDKSRDGLENLPKPEDEYTEKTKRDDVDSSPSLEFVKYQVEDGVGVLRLTWRTKYACEKSQEERDGESSKHWGFFTWFIIIAFLSTAAYLIFGSWLNYNRHGARGWDLLPHSDTIRDVPYLLKDWIRRVLNTVQGGGSRGGYAAV